MKELRNRNVKSVFGGIGIATLLCVLMVLMSWSAMVTNSDINNESAIEADPQDTKIDNMDKVDVEKEDTSFEAENLGFDEDREMLGMRTENTKTFLDDQGKQHVVISNNPLHYTNNLGQLVDIDTSIKTMDDGYYVQDIYNPVSFGNNAYEGFTMELDESEIVSGLDPVPVIVMHGQTNELQLPGVKGAPINAINEIGVNYFTPPTDNVEIGGSSILYPLAKGMELAYHVTPSKVKQEMIIKELSPELRLHLEDSTTKVNEADTSTSMFGLMETMILPENTQLFAGESMVTAEDGVFAYDSLLTIRNAETGSVVAYIDAPVASDSSENAKFDENAEIASKPNTHYFIQIAKDGQSLDIITAVNTEWLLDDYTVFPVLIDPTVGANTETTLTTPGSYSVCVVEDVDCFTQTDGRYEHDYSPGIHEFSPWFDFEFTQGTALSVAQVTAYVSWSNRIWSQSGAEYTSIQIMEDCGGNLPDGQENNLNSFANPAGCTGTPLPAYTPPAATGGATTYVFADFHPSWGTGDMEYHYECSLGYQYDLTSDQTSCQYGSSYDWIGVGGSGSASGPEESGGIFTDGDYSYVIYDSAGDSLDGNAAFHFETRAAGSTGPWTTILSEVGTYIGSTGHSGTLTVPTGDELRLAYHCPSSNCYSDENYMTLTPVVIPPTIPAAAVGVGGSAPTGSEPADVSFNVVSGEEAYFEFTSGSAVGDAEEVEIYYRAAGTSGWTDKWDICTGTDCAPNTQYFSYLANPSILFQIPGSYEILVWDTFGDGSGTGAGGAVAYASAGSTTGTIQNSPSGLRLVSLVSSEQIATFQLNSYSVNNRAVPLCNSVVDCNTGAMAMFVDAYKNTGYLEFTLGFPNGANNPNGPITGSRDGGAYFQDFYLVVELEDTTPDADPPTVEYDAHYTGVTSYVSGERTLFLSLMDTNNPIDTTTTNGPKLHYSTDGGNTYTVASATSTGTCNSKNQVCGFGATTTELAAGTTVDYYWTYTDAAAYDNTKIPAQTPNPGRFPAAGSADLTFTIGDIYAAPTDGTDMKIVTYMDHIRSAEPHNSVSTDSYASDLDRQMTYYTSSGEFHFEFNLDRCGSNFAGSGGVPGTDGQGNCFFDIDSYTSYGEQAGHWDINWEGVANDCSPGMTGCTGAPTNNLELDAYFGGPLGISGLIGAGNLIFVYDSNSNEWMISGAGTGISNVLDSSLSDVNSMSTYTSNIFTPTGPSPVTTRVSNGVSGLGGYVTQFTIASGDIGRLVYNCGSYCGEGGVAVEDTATGTVYDMGRNNIRSAQGGGFQTPIGTQCSSSSGFSGTVYSDSFNGPCNTVNTLSAGTYNLYHWDYYGDGSNGGTIDLQTIAASAGFAGGSTGPYETNTFNGRSTSSTTRHAQSYVIDLSSITETVGTNSGFGGVPFGAGAGEFNMICVTTAGHVMFMDAVDPRCTPDATLTSAGGQWQGFALGAGKTNFQYNGNGMLWQIRDVAPDPDIDAPEVIGAEMGDSHALERSITVSLSDDGPYDSGLDTSPVPGQGPTAYVTITSADGTQTSSTLALQPEGDRNLCATIACDWTADITNLARGDSVSYYITAKDTWPGLGGVNTVQTQPYTFTVANPTNTLVVEWHEYAYNTATSQPCSMQVVMYDVTNEFEYHYDDDCYVDDIVGLVGVRETQNNVLQVRNDLTDRYSTGSAGTDPGNPHDNNVRFTVTDSGDYAYEYFDRGMSFLPLVSSDQTIPVRSTTFSNDNNCDSNSDFSFYGVWCAGNFDIPDDFDFDFYGQSFDGADSNNRIHVIGSGMMYFIDDGDTNTYRHETSWSSNGEMYDLDTTSSLFPDMMMSPWWSRETMDYCYSAGSRTCEGVWYRTLPFDGQGKTVSADITTDTTWYAIDSPIKVNPTDPSGYLSITADLTIEPGVEVIVGENMGISFDGGLQSDGTCAEFTALGSGSDRITFDVDRSVNSQALWHGLAFTDDCGGNGVAERHSFDMVDISNTNYAAITAGSRPADSSGPSCGTASQDCNVGEFFMNDVVYTNVESAFSHGSGQGTVVTMSNFAVNSARGSCFYFAENTVATLTGTASNPSTMNGCNTNNNADGGAVRTVQGSTAGSLTMQYVDIVDSEVSLIRTDLQMITISDVTATMTNGDNNYRWTDNGNSGTMYDTTGVSLGLSHGAGSEVVITNFDAQNYAQGWICAAGKVSLTNVDLGTGFHNNHRFDIDPYCGAVTSTVGTVGTNSVFDDVTVADMTMYRTFPGTANDISVTNEFKIAEFSASGSPSDVIEFNNANVGSKFIIDGCDANVMLMTSSVGQLDSLCFSAAGSSVVEMINSNVAHSTSNSAIYLMQTTGTFVDVTVTSSVVGASGPYVVYADFSSDVFLIDVDYVDGSGTTNACADTNGKTAECHTGINGAGFGASIPEIYYGGFANALAYRLGQDSSTTPPTPTQIPEIGVTITASALDSTGAEVLPGKVIYRDYTAADGRATRVAVLTGDHDGNTYDSHIVRASGAAGAGEANPVLADGTPASPVEFIDGVLQTSFPLPDFTTYTIGSYADIRLTSPPVTLDDAGMNCAWMTGNSTFVTANTPSTNEYVFKQAELVLAADLDIDGCTVELKGTKLIFREDSVNNPTLTISNGGSLIMSIDSETGDLPKVFGEGNLDAVDIVIGNDGTLDMQGGTMKNFLLSGSKAGQLVVQDGGSLGLSDGAYLTSSDLSTSGSNDYPLIHSDGGIITVASSATLAGSGNLGNGVELVNGGELNGNGLTISNMLTGVDSDGGSINLDSFTSSDNTNGIIAVDGPKLPQVFSSATLQGITQNYPQINFGSFFGEIPGMDNCYIYHMYACFEWEEYTVDLSSWIGQEDYLQPSMMLNYGGMGFNYWSGWSSGNFPYIAMDNLIITITDDQGNVYDVDSSDDIGYYPYGNDDPEVVNNGATYLGGQGGVPNWDCNAIGTTLNPWRFGTNLYYNYYNSPSLISIGGLYGMTSNGYPDEFGFRLGPGETPEPIAVSSRPLFSWGYDEPFLGRWGPGASSLTNIGTYHDTTVGTTAPAGSNYETCLARGASYLTPGSNMLLEWPTLDLTDPSIEKVELKFDMWHRYHGSWANFYGNNFQDNVEVLARAGSDPSQFGEYSEEIAGKGVTLTNSAITGSTVGFDIKGNTITKLTNVDIDDPTAFAVRVAGNNLVYIDGLDVDDSALGANSNYGFYTESTSTGFQEIKNSDFNGLGTGIYLTNDIDTMVANTVLSNGGVGLRVGAQSAGNHDFDLLTVTSNDVGIKADGTGSITMIGVDIASSTTADVEITDGNTISFLDGTVDENKLVFDSTSTGKFDRDRTYTAVITDDVGNPLGSTNVVISSRDAASSSSGTTDSSGVTSGLSFSIYDYDALGKTDFTTLFNTYTLSTVGMVSYSYTDENTNDGDFRYIQTTPTLTDDVSDQTSVNYETFSLVDQIDVRICGTNSDYVMVAPCAGTGFSSSSTRTYLNGMVEYGDTEGLQDGTSTLDLTGKAIMIDTGSLELKDGVQYTFDNAIIFDTAYTTEYGTGITEWRTDVPYGTTITMNGGEVNGLYPETENGDVVGLIIGGLQGGDNEGALNLDFDGVTLNNIAGFATGTGDRTFSSFSGSFNTYLPSIVNIENSFINHYRGYFFYPTLYSDLDYCVRLSGVSSASISGNTFSDCTVGVAFFDSEWNSAGTTSVAHEQIGSDNVVIDGNTFLGASGYNVLAWPDSDTDLTQISNNVMTCNTCMHVRYMDDTSVMPMISGNTFNGGNWGVYTDSTEFVTIENNVFNNQAEMAIRAEDGDFDATGNTINNPGQYAIYAESLEKPGEVIESVVAGVNSPQPDDGTHYITWNSGCGGYGNGLGTGGSIACTSPDVTYTLAAGDEMIIRMHEGGSYLYELTVNYKDPSGNLGSWDPGSEGDTSDTDGTPSPLIFSAPGVYFFNLEDSYGDGANGGGFEIIKSTAGAWSASGNTNTNPKEWWDPGVAGLLTVEPGYRGPYLGYAYSPSSAPVGYSNTLDGVLLQNNGADPVAYEFTGVDQWGDGWNGNWMRMQVAPVGSWTTATTGYPPQSGNSGGPQGTTVGGIGGSSSSAYPWIGFSSGRYSDPIEITLDPGYEMRFSLHRGGSYLGEVVLQIQEVQPPDNSWDGPTIANNDINFDSTTNDPNTVGIYLSNCDVADYSITTESNTIDIGQNAVWNEGCIWNDVNSVITGSDQSGSVGYDDDNTFGFDITLDGTTITGFETGIHKTGGGLLTLTGDAVITAGDNGIGVHTEDISVSAIGATADGGTNGIGMKVEDSPLAWFYPMDVTGNVGVDIANSEILWESGDVDADTILIASTVSGRVQSLTDPASSGGSSSGPASVASTTMIDARSDSRLTVVDWPLDAGKILVDQTSIIEESNWLSIDANHLGAEPTSSVGLSIISDGDYTAYSSPVFEGDMFVDGDSSDWVGGNDLNPSGYAMPGSVGGPMYLTTDSGNIVFGFDAISTASSDVYIYVDSNDMAGTTSGFNGVHTLPYAADFVVVVDSNGAEVYYYNDPAWVLNPTANAITAEGSYLEVAAPISSLGGNSVNNMNIVATVQDVGTDTVSAVSPAQSITGTGPETLSEAYNLELNKLDLLDGTIDNEILLHRAFEFSNIPTAPHTYTVMVKTAAETRHTCDYDWATETGVTMSASQTLTFEIKRACPEITAALDSFRVVEDSGPVTLDLASFVDDEQDVEANMLWEVTGDNMDAFANILSDFTDLTGATGTFDITPINDQFGTFEMIFEVVDSHGQTASKTIVYEVLNINDAPVICDARPTVDPDCTNGAVYLYYDPGNPAATPPIEQRINSRDEGFVSFSKPLGKDANDTFNSFIRDMANEQVIPDPITGTPTKQAYTWGAEADCDQISVSLQQASNLVDEIVIVENQNWEEGGICAITLTLSDDGAENTNADPVTVFFEVAPVNDAPVIAVEGLVQSTDGSNSFQGVPDGSYRLDLVEDTTDPDALTFDLSGIKSDIDHVDADLSWTLAKTNTCNSDNYYQYQINGDILEFTLIPDATTNAEPWEVDKLNNNGDHQTRTANGRCEMTLTLSDSLNPPSYMPNYTALTPNNYQQLTDSVTLSIQVDNVPENVPDYYLDETEGFSFNGVSNVMPGTYVPVDFSIHAGGDQGPYTYDHLLVVSLRSDGHTEVELPKYYNPPAFGESLDIDDWEVYITDQTTEVWVEVDVVTCEPGAVCTPETNTIQVDNPESHNAISANGVGGKWSEPGRIGENVEGQESNRRPAFEDKNWCNNMMSTNGGTEVAWSDASTCGHSEQGYIGIQASQDWQTSGTPLPITVTTIGALSVASFAPSIIAVALTGLFVSALVLAGRRDDDEEDFVEETVSDDESAVSPVIATILMVAITVVLSGVVYVWAAQLADTDAKGVPRVTFSAVNVDTGEPATDHWKITVGQTQNVLATQAVEVQVTYLNSAGELVTDITNLASTNQVYGFSAFNSDQLVTFGDVVTQNGAETVSSFSAGDDIYVKTHDADGTPLVDATIRIVYNPPGDGQASVLKTYSGLSWNQPV